MWLPGRSVSGVDSITSPSACIAPVDATEAASAEPGDEDAPFVDEKQPRRQSRQIPPFPTPGTLRALRFVSTCMFVRMSETMADGVTQIGD